MIIAHLPAGYVASRLLFNRFRPHAASFRRFLHAGLLGSVAPDLDMLYFHLIDHRQHHHHTLWPHFPILWAGLLLASLIRFHTGRARERAALAVIFAANGLLHMVLDTVVGNIWWLAPFVDKPFSFFSVPARYNPWWLNFILHWTFILELAIVAWAIYLVRRSPDAPQAGATPEPASRPAAWR